MQVAGLAELQIDGLEATATTAAAAAVVAAVASHT
jgi:hypothetical protein